MAPVIARLRDVLALLIACAALVAPLRAADNVELVEQKIKAGLLYNFLKYTEWPPASAAQTGNEIVVCLYGGDAFDGHLTPMAGRTVNQKPITLRTIDKIADAGSCALVFVRATEKDNWPALQKSLTSKHALTVSDFEGFAAAGGMIEFARAESRIEVKLNVDAVSAANLKVSDRMLKLASVVHSAQE